mgnify:FL=1
MKENEKDARLEGKLVQSDFVGSNASDLRSRDYNSESLTERQMYQREERILLKLITLPYLMPCCDY